MTIGRIEFVPAIIKLMIQSAKINFFLRLNSRSSKFVVGLMSTSEIIHQCATNFIRDNWSFPAFSTSISFPLESFVINCAIFPSVNIAGTKDGFILYL